MQAVLAVCVYVSEARSPGIVRALQQAASTHAVGIFPDPLYNRTGVTLAAEMACAESLCNCATGVASVGLREAARWRDPDGEQPLHPTLGAVDHISCHPITEGASVNDADSIASSIAQRVASMGVPVHRYGPGRETLASIRRRLGYFSNKPVGRDPDIELSARHTIHANGDVGVCTIGAAQWVTGFNVLMQSMKEAREAAVTVSERRGGPQGVQAVALERPGEGAEVACNITHGVAQVGTGEIVERVKKYGRVISSYTTNPAPEEIVARVLSQP